MIKPDKTIQNHRVAQFPSWVPSHHRNFALRLEFGFKFDPGSDSYDFLDSWLRASTRSTWVLITGVS